MDGAIVPVRVQARARRNELVGIRDGKLIVRVTPPALDGRANRAVRQLLADRLSVPPSRVTIVRGHHHREKAIRVEGVDQTSVDAAFGF